MNNNQLQIIDERELLGKHFRIYGNIETPYFIAKDVCEWVEYDTSNVGKILKDIDEDEKLVGTIYLSGQSREIWMLSEDGVYEVLMQSRKPLAKEFKKQIKQVLKSIRKHGMYAKDELLNNPDLLLDVAQKLKEEKNKVIQLQQQIEEQKPKLELYEELMNSEGLFNFKQVGDCFGVGRNKLMKLLRNRKILSSNESNKNLPYSQYRKAGLFEVKITPRKTNEGLIDICTTLCHPKALKLIKKIIDKEKDLHKQAN